MATHSSVLAWRIPGTAESGGLLSTGSHRVGHDWSDLAATTAAYSIHRFSTSLANLYSCIYFEVSVMTDATISRKFLMRIFSSVQSLSHVWLFLTPWIAARQAFLSITNSRSLPNPCPLSRWYHPAISSSVVPFSSCPQSLPASGCFPMSQLSLWGGQSIGVSPSASVLPINTTDLL